MATNPITIKRYNGSSWDTLNPITTGQNVYGGGTNATTALLNSSDKINSAFYGTNLAGIDGLTASEGVLQYSNSAFTFKRLYEHNITFMNSSYGMFTLKYLNNSSTALNSYSSVATEFWTNALFNSYNNGKYISASGYWSESSSETRIVCGLYASSSSALGYRYITIASYSSSTTTIPTTSPSFNKASLTSTSITVYDYVRTLL